MALTKMHSRMMEDTFDVVGLGGAGDDATANQVPFQAAIDAANAAGGGIVQLPKGTFRLTGDVVPKSNVWFRGEGDQTLIKVMNGTSRFITPFTTPTRTALTVDASENDIAVTLPAGGGAGFTVGQYIGFESALDVFVPAGRAREIHQVRNVVGDVVTLDSPLVWSYTVADSATFENYSSVLDSNIRFSDLAFTTDTPLTNTGHPLFLNQIENLSLENIKLFDSGGGIVVKECQDVHGQDIRLNNLPNFNNAFGYGIQIVGASTNVLFERYIARDMRHAFTTLSDQRVQFWGGPRNVTVSNSVGMNSDVVSNGAIPLAIWDTHEFGHNITYENCVAEQHRGASACVQVRAQKVKHIGGRYRGGFRTVDLNSSSSDVVIDDCRITEGSTGACVVTGGANRPTIQGCFIGFSETRQVDIGAIGANLMGNHIKGHPMIGTALIRGQNDTSGSSINGNILERGAGGGQAFESISSATVVSDNEVLNVSDILTDVNFNSADTVVYDGNIYGGTRQNGGVYPRFSSATLRRHLVGMMITDNNPGGVITHTLPPAIVGDNYQFRRNGATYAYRMNPVGTEAIGAGGAGKYLSLDTDGAWVRLHCLEAGTWDLETIAGTTSFEP